ncbi:hypothetical protein ACGFY7_32270 [Streptomyces prunicolor]|uniref:hypothetical protein n=1 Tax=Streptomyces prunicolor TaxID=67348 RepID=UPI003712ED8D
MANHQYQGWNHQYQGWSSPRPQPQSQPQSKPQPQPQSSARPAPRRHHRFPRWRPLTWLILAFNAVMLIWLVTGINSASNSGKDCGAQQLCQDANDIGTAIGAGLIVATSRVVV